MTLLRFVTPPPGRGILLWSMIAVATGGALLMAGCGGTNTHSSSLPRKTVSSGSLPAVLPPEGFQIAAGKYSTVFEPRLILTLPEKVWSNDEDLQNFLVLYSQGTDRDKINRSTLIFVSPPHVDPTRVGKLDRTPLSLLKWVKTHPYFHVLRVAATTVGGVSAVAVDLTTARGRSYPDNCFGTPCKYLFPANGAPPVGVSSGSRSRLILLTVNGTQVVILPEAEPQVDPHCNFRMFGGQQSQLLQSVRFVSASK
jgi:hypothetical protein